MAEVLITLGIIGVVAAITLSSLITNIRNKGFVEHLLKTYSMLQTVTNKVVEENGPASSWQFYQHNIDKTDISKNEYIVSEYVKHMNVLRTCYNFNGWKESACFPSWDKVKSLNYQDAHNLDRDSQQLWGWYAIVLSDGVLLSISFGDNPGGGTYWNYPADIVFTVDVNGKKGPNKIGRDIFFFYLENSTGKVLPYASPDSTHSYANSCDKTKTGYSCAYRVITERKMNY